MNYKKIKQALFKEVSQDRITIDRYIMMYQYITKRLIKAIMKGIAT